MLDRPAPVIEWATDVLGEPYESTTLAFPDDDEGPVVATLVRRRASEPTTRAVLYVHGFADYFFQTHLADHFVNAGFDFYALDLRKCGRSFRSHQTPNGIASLADYAPELDASAHVIRDVDEHDVLLVNGHSSGALVATLWCHHRANQRLIQGMFLNSPFLTFNFSWLARHVGIPAVSLLAKARPRQRVPLSVSVHYVHSIHSAWRGHWTFDLSWKPAEGFPAHAGSAAAVRRAQRAVTKGLAIDAPILVMASTSSIRPRAWDDVLYTADAILNAEDIARLAPRLGSHVTIVRIPGGVHDLVLSGDMARARVFDELDRWISAYLPR